MANVTLRPDNETPKYIEMAEFQFKIKLTDGAVEFLSLPIDELLETGQPFSWSDVQRSMELIVRSMVGDRSPGAIDNYGRYTTLAAIRSLWANFCNMPPLCNRVPGGLSPLTNP